MSIRLHFLTALFILVVTGGALAAEKLPFDHARLRGRLGSLSEHGKPALGLIAAVAGVLVLTGIDKRLEAAIVAASPDWLVQLTTRF